MAFPQPRTVPPSSDIPGVVAPPPLIFAGFLVGGLALDALSGDLGINLPAWLRSLAAILLAAAAAVVLLDALRRFRRAGTRVEPWQTSTAMVTGGVYRRSRNPIYLAMAMAYLAVALAANGIFALLLLVPALVVIDVGVVRREERYLEARFGEPYFRYKMAVRRWV